LISAGGVPTSVVRKSPARAKLPCWTSSIAGKSGEISLDPLEIEAAEWFKIRDLPQLPNPISISRRLIDAVVAEMGDGTR
jgi:hypothetical protein